MKQLTKIFTLSIVFFAFSALTFAQVSATADASATIVTPITINKTFDLNFGNIAVSASAGTVDLDLANTRTATGVTLPVVTGTVTSARFDVTGTANATYSIILPGTVTLASVLGDNMTVDSWISSPTPTGNLGIGGAQTIILGATLHVGAAQPAGLYTNTSDCTVTVNYN